MKPTLLIMGAGLGSRFGGMKQLTPVGPGGEFIIDYSIYDAIRAGFGKVVFIIKKEYEQQFKESIGDRISRYIDVLYLFQDINNLPKGFTAPEGRVKPWGTAHAVYTAKGYVHEPFLVINSDDFYGRNAFEQVYKFLESNKNSGKLDSCMAGYYIENTLTENGQVNRGICQCDEYGYLVNSKEAIKISRDKSRITYEDNGTKEILPGTVVSMNCYGFMPGILDEFETHIAAILTENKDNLEKAEAYLPNVVGDLIKLGKTSVKVLTTKEKWYGVTYKEDCNNVVSAIRQMVDEGKYPEKLWNK